MAQLTEEAQLMIQSVQQAAKAAADAAQALRDIGLQQRPGGFSEANKTVQCPKEFGAAISAEDQNSWADFSFAFRQWLCFADAAYSSDLDYVEEHSDTPVTYTATPEGQASKARSCKLFAILAGILKNRPLRILRAVPESNGLEVWMETTSCAVCSKDEGQEYGHFECNYGISKLFQGENVAGASADA